MCGCFETSDFVCFFTFFITAIVALVFVQYFFIYLDYEMDDKAKMFYFCRCLYFFILTFLGCLVFAGVQRKSICLLKWPSRLLVTLIAVGLITLTVFLWTMEKIHKQSVRDLEEKTMKLTLVLALLFIYFFGVQKLISQIESPINFQRQSFNANLAANFIFDQSDQGNHPSNLVDIFRSKKDNKTVSSNYNVASNGVNYYKLLLEGSENCKKQKCGRSISISKISMSSNSIASITEV